ncbi:unnamed protein product [Colias eurytheme]|nr:unnamed protein product [Colias eurytheme]
MRCDVAGSPPQWTCELQRIAGCINCGPPEVCRNYHACGHSDHILRWSAFVVVCIGGTGMDYWLMLYW